VRLSAGDRQATFARPGATIRISALDQAAMFEPRATFVDADFLETASAVGSLEIVEASLAPDSPRTLRLSTAGLAEAMATLRGSCGTRSIASAR